MKTHSNNQRGIASFMVVLFLALLATFIVAAIQSRLLLSIYRQRSLSDASISAYHAETEVYDQLEREIVYNMPLSPSQSLPPLPDGTKLSLITAEDLAHNTQKIQVTATRPFAVNKIEAIKNSSSINALDKTEIILVLDCTSSMTTASDTSLPQSQQSSRLTEEKKAVLNLINFINTLPDNNKIFMGISVFRDNSRWLQASTDSNDIVTPTNDFSSNGRLIQAVNYAYTNATLTSIDNLLNGNKPSCTAGTDCAGDLFDQLPACNNPMTFDAVNNKWKRTSNSLAGNTSIGSGIIFAEDNLTTPRPPNTNQAIILVTDGEPSSAIADVQCNMPYYCSQYTYICYNTPKSGYNTGLKSVGDCEKILGYCAACSNPVECQSTNYCTIYYEQPTPPDKKRACLVSDYCYVAGEEQYNTDGIGCQNKAFSEIACAMADRTWVQVVENNYVPGRRDTQVPLYMLTIQETTSASFTKFRELYQKYLGDNYFELGNANGLLTKLTEILSDIQQGITTITIRRVVP